MLLVFALMTSPAVAEPWFLHRFGELRSYHGDWLAVCAENGQGACRAVQLPVDPAGDRFFVNRRLALHVGKDGNHVVEVFARDLAPRGDSPILFRTEDEVIAVDFGDWHAGAPNLPNLAETISVTNPMVARDLVSLFRRDWRLKVGFKRNDLGSGRAVFSLRGVTAALDAIATHMASRLP